MLAIIIMCMYWDATVCVLASLSCPMHSLSPSPSHTDPVQQPCNQNPCSEGEVCVVSSACSGAEQCPTYSCVPGMYVEAGETEGKVDRWSSVRESLPSIDHPILTHSPPLPLPFLLLSSPPPLTPSPPLPAGCYVGLREGLNSVVVPQHQLLKVELITRLVIVT